MKIVLLILLMFLPLIVRADFPRSANSFTSPNGQYVFTASGQPQARTWSLIETATKRKLYEIEGDFYSLTVLVGYDGKQLVMIDDNSEKRAEDDPEVLQFYLGGKKVKSYKLSNLLENTQNVLRSVSHFMWIAKPFLTQNFPFDRSRVSFTTLELNSFTFDINTGEIIEKKRDTELEAEFEKNRAAQEEQRKQEIRESKLRFDGLYCESSKDGRRCLRFYEDGSVIAASLAATLTDEDLATTLPQWFHRDSDKVLTKGKYIISKSKISFSTMQTNPNVKLKYTGKINETGSALILNSYNGDNGNRQKGRRFEFINITP